METVGAFEHQQNTNINMFLVFMNRVPTAQGKQGKWQKEFPVRENTGNLEILSKHRENTGNFDSSSCKCSDSESKGY